MISQAARLLKGHLSGKINYAIFFVTARCNAKCKTCFYWQNADNAGKNELTADEYLRISQKWKNLFHISLTGGEPLLRDDLPEIISHFYRNSGARSFGITTNGLLPDKAEAVVAKALAENPGITLKFSVSIDAIGEKHDEIRGVKGNYAKLTETITKLKTLAEKNKNLDLRINTTCCSYNKNDITKIIDHIDSAFGLPVGIGIVRGDARSADSKEITPEEYKKTTDYLKNKYKKRSGALAYFRMLDNVLFGVYDITHRIMKENAQIINCAAGRKMIVISEKGAVLPCEMLENVFPKKKFIFPDLRKNDYDIEKALKSPEFKEMLKLIKDSRCFCTFECATMNSLAYNPGTLIKLMLNFR